MELTLALIATLVGAAPAEDLTCLKPAAGEPAAATLFYANLQRQAYAALDRRQARYEQLKTPDEIAAYQRQQRDLMVEQVGGLPERGPLNAQVVGTIDADNYTIEKIIFDRQPRHHVTANLYLPKSKPPYPVVLV